MIVDGKIVVQLAAVPAPAATQGIDGAAVGDRRDPGIVGALRIIGMAYPMHRDQGFLNHVVHVVVRHALTSRRRPDQADRIGQQLLVDTPVACLRGSHPRRPTLVGRFAAVAGGGTDMVLAGLALRESPLSRPMKPVAVKVCDMLGTRWERLQQSSLHPWPDVTSYICK